jgi:hypothetical protein
MQESSRIELMVLDGQGRPAKDAQVDLTTNVGTLSPVQAFPGGVFRSVFKAPAKGDPDIALIHAAVRRAGAMSGAWLSLPIHARTSLNIRAPARAQVRVSLGSGTFGPVVASARGAVVPVMIAPGVTSALVSITPKSGAERTETQPLSLKGPARVRVVPLDRAASWAAPTTLHGFAVDAEGRPAAQFPPLVVSAAAGTTGPIQVKRNGTFELRFTPPEKAGQPIELSAYALDAPDRPVVTQLVPGPGPVAKVELAFTPHEFVAGSGAPVDVEVIAFDAKSNRIGPTAAKLTTDLGTVSLPSGAKKASLSLPEAFGNRSRVSLRAEVAHPDPTRGAVVGHGELPLRSGAPVSGEAKSLDAPPKGGAAEEVEVHVTFRDKWNNAVSGLELEASSPAGVLVPLADVGDGRYRFRFTPGAGQPAGMTTFEVRAKGPSVVTAGGQLRVPVRSGAWQPSLAALLFGQSNGALSQGLGVRLEGAMRVNKTPFEATLQLDGKLNRPMAQALPLSQTTTETKSFSLQTLSARGGARFTYGLFPQLAVFADAGAGLFYAQGTVRVEGDRGSVEEPVSSLGWVAGVGGGATWLMGPGRLIGQVQLSYAPGQGRVTGNLAGFSFGVGYLWTLGGGLSP